MIRDRLFVGIRDTALSEKLQMDADLMLEKAKKSIRKQEAIHEHQGILIGNRTSTKFDQHSHRRHSKANKIAM